MRSSNLEGVRVKLARALQRAGELGNLLRPHLEAANASITRDRSQADVVFHVGVVPRADPVWSAILGEGLYNLRSALDHLASQLVILDGGTPTRRTHMPLRNTIAGGAHPSSTTPIQPDIRRPDILKAVEDFQPYHRGGLWRDQLAVVNKLCNIDKHRLLLTIATTLNIDDIVWGLPEGYTTPHYRLPVGRPLRDGDELARFWFIEGPPPSTFNPHLSVQVTLAEGPDGNPYRLQGIDRLLSGLTRIVQFQLASHFLPLFPNERPLSAS